MNPFQKIILASAIFLFSVVFFGAGVLLPLFQGILKDSAQLLEQKKEIANIGLVEQSVKDFQEFSRLNNQGFEKIEELFSDPEIPIPFIEFVESIARESGFELKIIPSNARQLKGDLWPSAVFQLSSAGSYPNVFLFLKKLEQAPYLLEIQQVTLSQERSFASRETKEPQLFTATFSVVVKLYTKALKEEPLSYEPPY